MAAPLLDLPRDPDFAAKAGVVLDLYDRSFQGQRLGADEYVISADEKTSIQARCRCHPTLPPGAARTMRVEHEYQRGGALAYLAAWDVHRARLFGRCEPTTGIGPFGRLAEQVMTVEPYASATRVFWIVDNGSSHRGRASNQRLEGEWANLRLVHLPVHASWLNQVEIYFSVVQRKVLAPNDFRDLAEVEARLLGFQHRYQQTAVPSTGATPAPTWIGCCAGWMRASSMPPRHDRHPHDPPALESVHVWTVAASSPGHPPMTASPARPGAGTVVGAACWTLTVAYLLVQPVVAAAWPTPYDLATNSISDLGVTGCGDLRQVDDRVVYACSPRHALMNTVFVMVGLLTAAGAVLTRSVWPRRRLTSAGVAFVVLAGVGGILVGLAPANVNLAVHGVGALLQVPGAVGPLLLGVAAWSVQRPVAAFSLLCGVVGSAASLLYFSQVYLGLGPGGMEHLAFDPLTVWTTVLGVVLLGRWLAARRATR